MTEPLKLATRHLAEQRRIAAASMAGALREWRMLDARDLRASWGSVGPRLVTVLTAGQMAAASGANDYVSSVAAAEGAGGEEALVNAAAFAGVAADGRSLDTLMLRPLITAYRAIGEGATPRQALGAGRGLLATIVRSEVADAGRGAVGVGIAGRRTIQGYVRVVQPPACSRCIILAGTEWGWNKGFQRHPKCDCIHLPTTLIARHQGQGRGRVESDRFTPTTRPGTGAPGFINPRAYFDTLSRAEQNRVFGEAGARAIRDGGDMSQIVNARRGMYTADAYGRRVAATREGTTRRGQFYRAERVRAEARTGTRFARDRIDARRGLPSFQLRTPRLLPEEIYRLAEDREDAIRLLTRFGYLT
ncbi:hypothetical protein QA811_17680 [Streptomyces sp. B21-102]|uniref:hypothetical protein n=1 Tax=Streptomyces sp. B21-102 TaxID=3039416 RepID=UPI002FEEA804